jgi:hypothetical protein
LSPIVSVDAALPVVLVRLALLVDDFFAAPILISGLVSGVTICFGGFCAGAGGGGGGSGGGSGDGFGTSTLGDPPPPIHIINSPFD